VDPLCIVTQSVVEVVTLLYTVTVTYIWLYKSSSKARIAALYIVTQPVVEVATVAYIW